jgi:formate dehydrogenase iron-sulfur subunit
MKKCTLCADRIDRNERPACVDACPHGALTFGRRTALLREAAHRQAAEPDRYLPEVWGRSEWGGGSVLYISDVDLAPLGLGRAPSRSIPSRTDPVIHTTPHVAASVATVLVGLSWVIGRRNRVAATEARESEANDA